MPARIDIAFRLNGVGKRVSVAPESSALDIVITSYSIHYTKLYELFGARPVKRLIQKEIVNELSKEIIAGSIDKSRNNFV